MNGFMRGCFFFFFLPPLEVGLIPNPKSCALGKAEGMEHMLADHPRVAY